MSITAETTVGTIATEHPLATRVFARHQIDFCCGGGLPLAAACAQKSVEVSVLLDELRREIDPSTPADEVRWDTAPIDDLIDHLLTAYHEPQREEIDRILDMTRKVHRVHGDKAPERFAALLQTVEALHQEISQHFTKEEQVLFPMIRSGEVAMVVSGPIPVMETEHEQVAAMLRRLRELTDDYTVPAGACNTWTALWHALADLERGLHEHIHLENNVLHARLREA